MLNIKYVLNETNTDVRMYTCWIYSSQDLDTLLYKLELIYIGEYTGIYTIATIAWTKWEMLLEVNWQKIDHRITIAWESVTRRTNVWIVIPLFALYLTACSVNWFLHLLLTSHFAVRTIECHSGN